MGSATNRILGLSHIEQEWAQKIDILVDNRDNNLTALDLTGYTCTLSYGYNTSAGDEYSACAPLEVVSQKGDTLLSPSGDLVTLFTAKGVFDFMADDEASEEYEPTDTNSDIVETILGKICGSAGVAPTLPPFTHCKGYNLTIDSRDSLINTYTPADYFRVGFKESRLSVFKKALAYTKCKARVEADGAIHIFSPTVSGTTYAYQYNDAIVATNHNFFEKSVRNRLVVPNQVYVKSHPDQGSFIGSATDAASRAALGRYITEYQRVRVTSDEQAKSIAEAMIQNYQLEQERGHGFAPLNCGQEVMDYVKITDSVANDTRTGNISYIRRNVAPSKFEMEFRFGKPELSATGLLYGEASGGSISLSDLAEAVRVLDYELGEVYERLKTLTEKVDLLEKAEVGKELTVKKLRVTEQLIIPVWPDE